MPEPNPRLTGIAEPEHLPGMAEPEPSVIRGYLAGLAARLPASVVEELADGLTETYRFHLSRGLASEAAAGPRWPSSARRMRSRPASPR